MNDEDRQVKVVTGADEGVLQTGTGKVSVNRRANGETWHLGAAVRFAKECAALETPPIDSEALLHHSLSAVILSACAMESYANKLLFEKLETEKANARDEVDYAAQLRELKDKYRFSGVLRKIAGALEQRDKRIDTSADEYKRAAVLIAVRNSLVHLLPEWTNAKDEHATVAESLRVLGVGLAPCSYPTDGKFPEDWMGAELAVWACRTAHAFLVWARDAAGERHTLPEVA